MNDLDDLLDPDDPEVRTIMAQLKKHAEYHESHPDQCPHNGIVAPVVESLKMQPGYCLDCHANPVMARETGCPLCKEERT